VKVGRLSNLRSGLESGGLSLCHSEISEALKRDESGEANIYSFNLLETIHMAVDAWNDVTPETIKNCWKHKHADIRREPLILRIPQTLAQRGWNVIHTFADLSSGMTLPQAEDSLKKIFGDQYNDDEHQSSPG